MNEPLTSFERAARLFKEAEKLGCDAPTENMIAEAIQDAEFDTFHNPEIISQRHGGQRTSVLLRGSSPAVRASSPDLPVVQPVRQEEHAAMENQQ